MESVKVDIFKNLPNVDQDRIRNLVAERGLRESANLLGQNLENAEYPVLAGRLQVAHIYNTTPSTVREYIKRMGSLLDDGVARFIFEHETELQELVNSLEHKFYRHNFFSIGSQQDNHLGTDGYKGPLVERPGMMMLRVAVKHYKDLGLDRVKKMYTELVDELYSCATPTLKNTGTARNNGISCFMIAPRDSIDSIYDVVGAVARMLKSNAGVGVVLSHLRGRHSSIARVGQSAGVTSWLSAINNTITNVEQLGTRKGAATCYLGDFHCDMLDFISMFDKVQPDGKPAMIARGCVWISRLFMERLDSDGMWSFFCPDQAKGLSDCNSDEFRRLYLKYEAQGIYKFQKKASEVWRHIVQSIQRTGSLHIMNADACNYKSNYRNEGNIAGANLCTETVQVFNGMKSIASCNLSSINLRRHVKSRVVDGVKEKYVDYDLLGKTAQSVVDNLNRLIDVTNYPLPQIKEDNLLYRPIGVGTSGLAEVFKKLLVAYDSSEARYLNKVIYACIYFNSWVRSVMLAEEYGACSKFKSSPMAQGKLQFDLWKDEYEKYYTVGIKRTHRGPEMDQPVHPSQWGQVPVTLKCGLVIKDWNDLSHALKTIGAYNMVITMAQPTASTSQTIRNTEMYEPSQSNMYSRRTKDAVYGIIDKYLYKQLLKLGLWNQSTYDYLKATTGSVRGLDDFILSHSELYSGAVEGAIDKLRKILPVFKTAFEMSNRVYIDMSADRARYMDHSQSFNMFMNDPDEVKLSAALRYALSHDLKTAIYYLRTTGSNDAVNLTVDPKIQMWVEQNASKLGISKINKPSLQTEEVCVIREDGTRTCCDG